MHFLIKDRLSEQGKKRSPDGLLLDSSAPALLKLLKLMSGCVDIFNKNQDTELVCKAKVNYFQEDFRSFGSYFHSRFPSLLSPELSSKDLEKFILAKQHENRKFYEAILSDTIHLIALREQEKHTASFVLTYRLLERISYAFPLIYTSKTNDFLKTYDNLKKMLAKKDSKGELGFFRAFIHETINDKSLLQNYIELPLSDLKAHHQEDVYKALQDIVDEKIIDSSSIFPDTLSIKYPEMGSFIITLRNGCFHNLNGFVATNNLDSSKIYDFDDLFKVVTPYCVHWIATIVLHIVRENIDSYLMNTQT